MSDPNEMTNEERLLAAGVEWRAYLTHEANVARLRSFPRRNKAMSDDMMKSIRASSQAASKLNKLLDPINFKTIPKDGQ